MEMSSLYNKKKFVLNYGIGRDLFYKLWDIEEIRD
jgi:hypothetical protein